MSTLSKVLIGLIILILGAAVLVPAKAGHNSIHDGLVAAAVPYMYLSCVTGCPEGWDGDRIILFDKSHVAAVCNINGVTKVELAGISKGMDEGKGNKVHICEPT